MLSIVYTLYVAYFYYCVVFCGGARGAAAEWVLHANEGQGAQQRANYLSGLLLRGSNLIIFLSPAHIVFSLITILPGGFCGLYFPWAFGIWSIKFPWLVEP